ncbi:MAG: proline dehydrogenase family protein [Nocardioides sp.]|uniref:proline dehydrogenase family protein n=1 Tax=Nocardioides sp. TaxID=35761 RepID=UPI0039E30F02
MFSEALGGTLDRASRSRRVRRLVETMPITQGVVRRFVAGETTGDAVSAATGLVGAGRLVTLDSLGEHVTDPAGARATRDSYLDLLTALAEGGCAAGADVSLKLTALGQALPDSGAEIALTHAAEICAAASAVGCSVTLDMEDHTTADTTLEVGQLLRKEYGWVGNVLQSNLRRTPGDITALATEGTRIRLVKGAYREPASVAYQRKSEVDEAYRRDLDALIRSGCYPMIATHDPAMISRARQQAGQQGRSADSWELQMLYGIRTDLAERAVADGYRMRIYLPYGTDWYGYFMRRLAERPANVAFFLRALTRR